jgi:uncharacterized protein YkwD
MFRVNLGLRRTLVAVTLCSGAVVTGVAGASPAAAATPTATHASAIASQVLLLLNHERAAHRLPSLRMNSHLITSAHAHNVTMARNNKMSHQLAGEANFADRITHAGYRWQTAGENIGWNSDWSLNGALLLQRIMYNEKAPADGHRRNILNRSYRDVGIHIVMDTTHHKMWITLDFGRGR